MPEIVNRNSVQKKLSEFDERMDGAIKAAEIIMQVEADTVQVSESINEILMEVDELRSEFEPILNEWESLKEDILITKEDTINARKSLLKKVDEIKPFLESFIKDSENRLRNENELSRKEHIQLEIRSREHFQGTLDNHQAVVERSDTVEKLIANFRHVIENEVQSQLNQFEEKFRISIESLQQTTDKKLSFLDGQLKKSLAEHQQGIDRQITEFLNKQNALVQNLTQQIDGFHRLAQTLSVNTQQTGTKLQNLEENINSNIDALQKRNQNLDDRFETMTKRMEQVLDGLKSSWAVGSKFKNI